MAGAEPVIAAARRMVPSGSVAQTRYMSRKIKGKRNNPSVVTRITAAGNLASSQTVTPSKMGAVVGVRMKPGGGVYAEYAAAVHKRNPWLAYAGAQAQANSQAIMAAKIKRMIQSVNL